MRKSNVMMIIVLITIICGAHTLAQNVIPELEKQNFKVDSKGWKKEKKTCVIDGVYTSINMNVNNQGDIWEFPEDSIPEFLKIKQLFTYDAAVRETKKAGKKLPPPFTFTFFFSWNQTTSKYENKEYQNWVNKNNIQCTGCRAQTDQFLDIGKEFYLWRNNGSFIYGTVDGCGIHNGDPGSAAAIRCLKE